jgi:uncharacterized SAM-binding protein YcdF (DUF218 family)
MYLMHYLKLLTVLISPLETSLLFAIAGLMLAGFSHRKRLQSLGKLLQAFAVLWLWLWSLPAMSFALIAHLESNYPAKPMVDIPTADAIVVLGGAIAPPMPPQYPYPNLNNRGDRIWQGARLYHAGKAPIVILSGAFDPKISPLSEADAMAMFMEDLGVPASALRIEGESLTTAENAQYVARLLKPHLAAIADGSDRGTSHILLVTSAIHLYRAKALFEKEGFIVEPVAIDHEAVFKPTGIKAWVPDADALAGSAKAIKEQVGRWVY